MDLFLNIFAGLTAYLLGTLPIGIWVTTKKGVSNLQNKGSGNIGATNVLRVFGKKAALLTLSGDVGKGMLAVFLMTQITSQVEWHMAAGFLAVCGHIYPITRKGKGGKGVATGFGVLLVLHFGVALSAFILWAASIFLWRISSLGAIIAFISLPFVVMIMESGLELLAFSICLSSLILSRHVENIKRLWYRKEPKIGASK